MTNYLYDEHGILLPQRLHKYELAYFYGRSPRQFRRELADIVYVNPGKYYSRKTVAAIMRHLDTIYREDVENAQPRIAEYLAARCAQRRNNMSNHQ